MPNTVPSHESEPPAGASSIQVRGIAKAYGASPVLHDVSLAVRPGSTLALLGPSGCGKTTLLRIIAGLERPERGEVVVGGRSLTSAVGFVPPERRRVGMVFQDWALFPHLTVARNVAYGLPRRERRSSRVAEALALVGLEGMGGRLPWTLSGGEQQRVALARALAPRPAVLLLDEPFSNLDAALRVQVRAEVHRLLTDLGITAIFVTHDQAEAFLLGDEVAVVLEGRVVQQARPSELYAAPATRWIAGFVGEANLVPGDAQGDAAGTAIGLVALANDHHGPVDVLVRPEELCVDSRDRAVTGADATVDLVEFYGHDTVYVLRLHGGAELRARVGSAPHFVRGDRVRVTYGGRPAMAYDRADRADRAAEVPVASLHMS
jgi:iron(III) transport system ATP-binding protein